MLVEAENTEVTPEMTPPNADSIGDSLSHLKQIAPGGFAIGLHVRFAAPKLMFNCYPAEIENALYDSGYAAQVAVIGVPDERMGEVGMAFLVAAPGKEVSADIVRDWSRENMANYKVPRYIEIVDELPVNASGKVTKFVLREQAEKILSTQE